MIPNVDLRVKYPGTEFDTVTTFGRNISARGVMLALKRKAPRTLMFLFIKHKANRLSINIYNV